MTTEPLEKFLEYLPGQKEVALVIAHGSEELAGFSTLLEGRGFFPAESVSDLLSCVENEQRAYLLADGTTASQAKEIYDFTIQYPSGQVQIWDKENSRMAVASPSYRSPAPILLTTTHNLTVLEGWGLALRRCSGLAYQSE